MKIRLFNMGASSLIMILFMASCTGGPNTAAADSLKSFYKSYIAESNKVPEDQAAIGALKSKHCTAKYLGQLAGEELEADPFLNAQDVDPSWAETLEVTPDDVVKDQFAVCFPLADKSKHCVEVTMVEDGGSWKIDNITH